MMNQNFHILIISLPGDHPRKSFQRAQMARLGLQVEFLDAVTPETMPATILSQFADSWARPLRPRELALTHSHLMAWRALAKRDAPTLVLEDDVVLSRSAPSVLASLAGRTDMEFVQLETFNNPKLLSKSTQDLSVVGYRTCRLYRDRGGAAAGLIWPAAGLKLAASVEKWYPPADAAIDLAAGLARYQVMPACAVQAMNFPSNLDAPLGMQAIAPSIVSDNPRPKYTSRALWLRQKLRRLGVSFQLFGKRLRAGANTVTLTVTYTGE